MYSCIKQLKQDATSIENMPSVRSSFDYKISNGTCIFPQQKLTSTAKKAKSFFLQNTFWCSFEPQSKTFLYLIFPFNVLLVSFQKSYSIKSLQQLNIQQFYQQCSFFAISIMLKAIPYQLSIFETLTIFFNCRNTPRRKLQRFQLPMLEIRGQRFKETG